MFLSTQLRVSNLEVGSGVKLNCLHCIPLKGFLNITLKCQWTKQIFIVSHLWSGSKINDSIQFKALAKLVIHPVMPVLINGPLCFIHAVRFIQIRCKNIPERESTSTHKFFPCLLCSSASPDCLLKTEILRNCILCPSFSYISGSSHPSSNSTLIFSSSPDFTPGFQIHISILVPGPGIEPVPLAVEAQSPNHWTSREFPIFPTSYWISLLRYSSKKNFFFKPVYPLSSRRFFSPLISPFQPGPNECTNTFKISLLSVHSASPLVQFFISYLDNYTILLNISLPSVMPSPESSSTVLSDKSF